MAVDARWDLATLLKRCPFVASEERNQLKKMPAWVELLKDVEQAVVFVFMMEKWLPGLKARRGPGLVNLARLRLRKTGHDRVLTISKRPDDYRRCLSCKEIFFSARHDPRKSFCDRPCKRRALKRRAKRLEDARKRQSWRTAYQAFRRLKRRPKDPEAWVAKRAGVTKWWVTRTLRRFSALGVTSNL